MTKSTTCKPKLIRILVHVHTAVVPLIESCLQEMKLRFPKTKKVPRLVDDCHTKSYILYKNVLFSTVNPASEIYRVSGPVLYIPLLQ